VNLLTITPAEFCAATNACIEGRDFALKHATMSEVWDNCPRPDWLMWIAQKIELQIDDRTLRLFAVWCARNTPLMDSRTTLALLTDQRSVDALKVAKRFANGKATAQELAAAWAAARAAASAAARAAASAACDAARDAASAAAWAAWAAARAAWSAAARDAASAAAWAACDAARDAAWDAAWDAARDAARSAQSAHLRTLVPNPFKPQTK